MTPLLMLVILAQAPAADTLCKRQGDLVTCGSESFRKLTDTLIDVEHAKAQCDTQLLRCETTKAWLLAAPPPAPVLVKPPIIKPVVAVVAVLIGGVAITSAAAVDALTPELRLAFGVSGAAAVAAGFTIVFF